MCLTKTGVGDSLSLTKKLEGRKVQFSPFLLSRNIRKSHLKDRGFLSKRSNPLQASHRRLEGKVGSFQTNYEHMPKQHQEYHSWDADKFVEWGKAIGPHTKKVIKSILASSKVEQQAYRTCMSVLNLEKKYGSSSLEEACQRALT